MDQEDLENEDHTITLVTAYMSKFDRANGYKTLVIINGS